MANIVITGANRGIGLELARLRTKGHTVVAVCREPSAELSALGVRVEPNIELTSEASVRELVERLGSTQVDVLVNNAGILSHEELDDLDFEAIRKQFEVNALGPLRVTAALVPRMKRGSKVAIITSRMGSIGDNSSGGSYGYRMSKAAVNAAGVSLARDLAKLGIEVALLHPGFVRTQMTGGHGNIDATDAARLLWQRIDGLTLETSGTFWHANGEILPW